MTIEQIDSCWNRPFVRCAGVTPKCACQQMVQVNAKIDRMMKLRTSAASSLFDATSTRGRTHRSPAEVKESRPGLSSAVGCPVVHVA